MAKIFLSYRRDDSAAAAGRIYDRLRAYFGSDAVFIDVDNIPIGVNFRKHLDSVVSRCDVVLAVIGKRWAGEAEVHRRLDDPRDFVRIELESALKREIPVIPILIEHSRMPSEADLPASLALLADYNAIDVDQGRDFHHHVDLLIKGIEFHLRQGRTHVVGPSDPARDVRIERPLKELGLYSIKDIVGELKLWLVPDNTMKPS
jgi:TIR domain-containing protein